MNVRIVLQALGRGEVFLDDKKIEGVMGLDFSAGAGKLNTLTLTLCVDKATIEGPAGTTLKLKREDT